LGVVSESDKGAPFPGCYGGGGGSLGVTNCESRVKEREVFLGVFLYKTQQLATCFSPELIPTSDHLYMKWFVEQLDATIMIY